jgi:hypothetical protein
MCAKIHQSNGKGEVHAVSGRTAIIKKSTTRSPSSIRRVDVGLVVMLWLGASILMILPLIPLSLSAWAATAQAPEHLSKYLDIPLGGGTIPKKLRVPVYEQNTIQYFSAGLGKEERSLSYPPYPLKLIFVKGERAFLAGVAIEVLHPDQKSLISIPGEEVQGPWLFLNLPAGKYVLKATDSNGTTLEKSITLATKDTTTVHFRWP